MSHPWRPRRRGLLSWEPRRRCRRPTLALSLFVSLLCGTSCGSEWKPLDSPIAADRAVPFAARMVLADGDLAGLAGAVRLSGGKVVDMAAAPLPLPGPSGYHLASIVGNAVIGDGVATWTVEADLAFHFDLQVPSVALAVTAPGGAACAFTWAETTGDFGFALRFGRSSQGVVQVAPATEPTLELDAAALSDPDKCLGAAGPVATSAILDHIASTLETALAARYVGAATAVVRAVFPPGTERAGRTALTSPGAAAQLEARLAIRYHDLVSQGGETGHLIERGDGYGAAFLEVGFDTDRHACAVDVPPPTLPPQGPPTKPTNGESGGVLMRRALVLAHPLLSHLAWVANRAGTLCRSTHTGFGDGLPASWAGGVLPELGPWVDGAPTGARFWPGASPTIQVVDTAAGGAAQWVLPMALLEVSGHVRGVELIVLRIEGTFRVAVQPSVDSEGGIRLEIIDSRIDSAVVTSPLLAHGAGQFSKPNLSKIVAAAMAGIFADAQPLQATGLLPADTVALGTLRVGENLWMWLAGGALADGR